jgi:hypothetical protein
MVKEYYSLSEVARWSIPKEKWYIRLLNKVKRLLGIKVKDSSLYGIAETLMQSNEIIKDLSYETIHETEGGKKLKDD